MWRSREFIQMGCNTSGNGANISVAGRKSKNGNKKKRSNVLSGDEFY